MNTDNPRPDLTPQQRASLERGLAQSAAAEVYDLGSFAEYANTPNPERVTLVGGDLTLLERVRAEAAFCRAMGLVGGEYRLERIATDLASREQALREEIEKLRLERGEWMARYEALREEIAEWVS